MELSKMEKQPKSKNKILKFLPKVASAVHFQNPPFSPTRDKRLENHYFHRHKAHVGKGFSGHVVSIIPHEIRRKPNNGSSEPQEPMSPKVSCMGQIKHKKKVVNMVKSAPVSSPCELKKHDWTIKNNFRSAKPSDERRRFDFSVYDKQPLSDGSTSLGQTKKFASGRDTFANFEWKDQIAPVDSDHREDYSDEEEEKEHL